MPPQSFTYHGPHIHHPSGHERAQGASSTLSMAFATAKGTLRDVPITRDQALKTIHTLSGFLITLDRQEDQNA